MDKAYVVRPMWKLLVALCAVWMWLPVATAIAQFPVNYIGPGGGPLAVWNVGTNWNPTGVPITGFAVNIDFNDGIFRNISYNYSGAPVTLFSLNVDDASANFASELTMPASPSFSLSATTEYVGNSSNFVGGDGTGEFLQNGGSNTVGSGGLVLGNTVNDDGDYQLSGTGSLLSGASEFIGNQGFGSFEQGGGTNTIQNGFELHLGVNSGADGEYNLSGGSLTDTTGANIIGENGTGAFNQTGGTNSVGGTGGLILGLSSGSSGTYTLSAGSTSVTNSVWVGGSSSGSGGTGVLTVSGTGTLTVSGTLVAYNTTGSKINLTGGTINAAALNFNNTPSLLNWTSGTLNITSNVTFDSSAGGMTTSAAMGSSQALGSGQTLEVTGNETLGGTGPFGVTVNSGGSNTVTGNLAINHTGSLTVNAGGTATAQNVIIGESSTALTTVAVGGANAKLQAIGGGINVGDVGQGALNVSNGGKVTGDTAVIIGAGGSSIGQATITNANSLLQAGWYINVGWNGQAMLTVDNGGKALAANAINIGEASTAVGTANVGGTNTGSILEADWGMNVGDSGHGTLNVNNGGSANIMQYVNIGNNSGSVGQTTISGASAVLSAGWGLTVGEAGNGTLSVDNGGSASAANWFTVGDVTTGIGSVTVGGTVNPNSTSSVSGAWGIAIGANGTGTFTINNGGMATSPGGLYLGFDATGKGTVYLNSGGTISTTNGSNVWVGGSYNGTGGKGVLNVAGGTINVSSTLVAYNTTGSQINFSSGTINAAALNFNGTPSLLNWTGGTLNINNNVTFDPSAAGTSTSAAFGSSLLLGNNQTLQISGNETLGSGTGVFSLALNFGATNAVTGTFAINSGSQLNLNGGGAMTVGNIGALPTISGGVLIGSGGTVGGTGIIIGAVFNNSGTVSPGFSPGVLHITGITGSYYQAAGGTLSMELAGTTVGTQYDQLQVAGNLQAGGTLAVSLLNGYHPLPGNSFRILDWGTVSGSLSGTFSSLELPMSGHIVWDSSQLYTTGTLSVSATYYAGDFNRDNHVDAADVVAMESALANLNGYQNGGNPQHETLTDDELLLIGDLNGDGVVNSTDLQSLLTLLKSGGGSTAPVPEPSTFVLAVVAFGILWWRFRYCSGQKQRCLAPGAVPSTR